MWIIYKELSQQVVGQAILLININRLGVVVRVGDG